MSACGSDHHMCIAPEADHMLDFVTGVTGGGGCHDGSTESEGGKFMFGTGPVAGPECATSVSEVEGANSGGEELSRAHAVGIEVETCLVAPLVMSVSCCVGTCIEVDH